MQENIPKKTLSTGQKTGFVLLLVFALLTVGLTFLQVRNTIYGPFVIRISQEELQVRESMQFDETVRLQQIDTDRDGLTDYEELNFYETSPYLPDTDSDGLGDKEELDLGKNPLCPEGTLCDTSEFLVSNSSTLDFTFGSQTLTPSQILVQSQFNNEKTASSTIDLREFVTDPLMLRQLLLATGKITEQDLKQISDAQLLQFAEQTAQQEFDVDLFANTPKQESSP